MVTMRPANPSDPAILRIANMSPGSAPVSGDFESNKQSVALGAVSYADVGDRVRIKQRHGRLKLRSSASPQALVTRQLHLRPGSNTMVYLVSADADHASIVIDPRSPLRANSK